MTKQSPPSEYPKLRYVRGECQRCARLEKALREAMMWDGEDDHGVEAVWLRQARAALSDTAQQPVDASMREFIDKNRNVMGLQVEMRKWVAEMRERAAKLVEEYYGYKSIAPQIRALPIDPETGGSDE